MRSRWRWFGSGTGEGKCGGNVAAGGVGTGRAGCLQMNVCGAVGCVLSGLTPAVFATLVVLTCLQSHLIVDGLAVIQSSHDQTAATAALHESATTKPPTPISETVELLQRIRRKPATKATAKGGSRPATCTCTCETVMTSAGSVSHVTNDADKMTYSVPAENGLSPQDTGDYPWLYHQQQQDVERPSPADYYGDGINDVMEMQRQEQLEDAAGHNLAKMAEQPADIADQIDKFSGNWGHGSRYPWTRLPNRMCFRDPCQSDRDCCQRYNICDRSAHVCVDCWYGSPCSSQRECCSKYPQCRTPDRTYLDDNTNNGITGKCVDD